jgi:hypothetical protein
MAQIKYYTWGYLNTVMNLRVPCKVGTENVRDYQFLKKGSASLT